MIQNGIEFNSVKNNPVQLSRYPLGMSNQQGPDEEDGKGIINVVDIDWNGAQLSLPEELNLGTTITICY